jgi:hypothetical protein
MKKRPNQPDSDQPGGAEQALGNPGATGDKVRAQVQEGQQPVKTDQAQPPGEGNLPPVPDRDELVAMAPEDAAAHLEQAAERVLRERREHQHVTARPPSGSMRDW